MAKKQKPNPPNKKFYPPVVAVVGHVDHGKTALLDTIRKSNVAQKEYGGITQRIGASKIEFINEGEKKAITFIDTPGHELFSNMRGKGIMAADIGLLVVSSVDGVMPQTRESIKLLKEVDIPFIVVLTKSDLAEKNPEKAKRELLKAEVLLEGYGGDVPVVEVSAKTNTNIKELLDLILLVFEIKKAMPAGRQEKFISSESGEFKGVVIESKQDQRSGPLSSVVIKSGTLSLRDEISSNGVFGKVKSLTDASGKKVDKVTIGEAVEILGFEKVPKVGSIVLKKFRVLNQRGPAPTFPPVSAPPITSEMRAVGSPSSRVTPFSENLPILSLIICADTLGSLEAIINALPNQINIVSYKTGDISPADLLLAKGVGAIVLGFNIKIKPEIIKLAKTEEVVVKNYNLIYELIDEITDVLEGRELSLVEEILGRAKIVAQFPFEKTKVMGVAVLEGRVAKGDKIRITRKDEVVGQSTISSLRQGKNQISKVEKGNEAGIIISPFLDFTIGDMVISLG